MAWDEGYIEPYILGLLTSSHGSDDDMDIGFPRQSDFWERVCTSLHGGFGAIAGCNLGARSAAIVQSGFIIDL